MVTWDPKRICSEIILDTKLCVKLHTGIRISNTRVPDIQYQIFVEIFEFSIDFNQQ